MCLFPPVRFSLTGSDGPLATSKTAPAEKSGLPVGPENGELSKEELIRRKREEFIQKHGKGLDKSRLVGLSGDCYLAVLELRELSFLMFFPTFQP